MELNMELVRALQHALTTDQLDLLVNAMTDHYDDLRHDNSGIIGQLYDGDPAAVNTAYEMLITLERAARRSM